MALSKLIKQENGLVLGYHRILLIESMINNHTSISVVSYLDEPSREMEKWRRQRQNLTWLLLLMKLRM